MSAGDIDTGYGKKWSRAWGEVCMESVSLYRLAKVVHNEQVSKVALMVRNQFASAEDLRDTHSITTSGRSPGGWHGNPLWYSCLENSVDRGGCWSTVHKVTKHQRWLKWLSTHMRHWNDNVVKEWATGKLMERPEGRASVKSLRTELVWCVLGISTVSSRVELPAWRWAQQ